MGGKVDCKPPLLVLVGPTAVGKSDLALQVAHRLQAEIICADSAQVYKGLDIGTAKPTALEQALVPHHLFGLVSPDQEFSAAAYQKAAGEAIKNILLRGKLPLLVGGTGLYIRAVTGAYAFGARGKDPDLRERLNREADKLGLDELYKRLAQIDPVTATRIHRNDRRRIIRALEFYSLEGKPICEQVELTANRVPPYNLLMFGLTMPRPLLYRRIDDRVETMLQRGFLDEVKALLRAGYSPECPGLRILGYRQLSVYILGGADWQETVEEIKKQTRRLAKRQYTWFKKESKIIWLEVGEKGVSGLSEIICRQVKEILPLQTNNIF